MISRASRSLELLNLPALASSLRAAAPALRLALRWLFLLLTICAAWAAVVLPLLGLDRLGALLSLDADAVHLVALLVLFGPSLDLLLFIVRNALTIAARSGLFPSLRPLARRGFRRLRIFALFSFNEVITDF